MSNNIISKLISKIKGEEFTLDENIPKSYIVQMMLRKAFGIIRGYLTFFQISKRVFVARKTKINAKSKIILGKNASFDYGSYVDALSKNGIIFGNNVSVGKFSTIECTGSLRYLGEGLKIGNNVGIGTHGFWGCAGGVEIGDDTIFGNFVSLHSENHNFEDSSIPIRLQGINRKGIKIGSNCWIGAKVTILDGVTIENGCIIAAGSVLTEGLYKENSIYGGIPAKFLRKRF